MLLRSAPLPGRLSSRAVLGYSRLYDAVDRLCCQASYSFGNGILSRGFSLCCTPRSFGESRLSRRLRLCFTPCRFCNGSLSRSLGLCFTLYLRTAVHVAPHETMCLAAVNSNRHLFF